MDRHSPDLASPQGAHGSTAGDGGPKRTFASRLFGYDIFLSFAIGLPPRGTQSYASDLARRLRERDFSVFFSEDEAPPGERLDSTLRTALLQSRTLVVVANRGTLQDPRWVRDEVEEFRKRHPDRPVIAINVGGALQDPTVAGSAQEWLGYKGKIWLDESEEAVATGIASESVVKRLATAPARAKANVKWRWVARLVIAMLVALAIGLGIFAKVARDNAQIALSRQLAAQSAAELTHNRETSLLLAMQAMRHVRTYQAEEALTNAVLAYPHRIALRKNTGPLWDVAFSPDGKRVVTASKSGPAHYWAADTGELLAELSDFQRPLYHLAFSPDGAFILGRGQSVRVWNANTLKPVDSDLNRRGDVSDARFSPSGALIVTGYLDGTASVWEPRTGRRVVELRGHARRVATAAFSPDETQIVTASDDGAARIWRVPSGDFVRELKGHTHRLISAEFSPDGRHVLTAAGPFPVSLEIEAEKRRGVITDGPRVGGRPLGTPEPGDNTARIWDVATGKVVAIRPLSLIHKAGFARGGKAVWLSTIGQTRFFDLAGRPIGPGFDGGLASFSTDGSLFATIELDETVHNRRMDDFKSLGVFPGELATFSPDGRRILTANPDGSVFIWNMDLGRGAAGLHQSTAEFVSTSFSRDGALVATIDKDGTARLWDASSGAEVTSAKAPDLASQQTRQAVFGNGTDILLTLGSNGDALLRNLASGKILRFDSPFPVEHAEFGPDGSRVLTRFQRKSEPPVCNLQLWNSETGKMVAEICLTSEEIPPYARFGSDGAWIETTTASGAQIWDAHDGHHVADFTCADSYFTGSDCYVGGSNRLWVATVKSGNSVPIWDARTGRPAHDLKAYARADTSSSRVNAKFSPNGSLVMTFGDPIRVWDPGTGKKLAEFNGTDAVFSPDGRMVASVDIGRNEMVAHVWEARTGKSVAKTQLSSGFVQNVAFSPDGKWLLTWSGDRVGIWDAGTGRTLRQFTSTSSREILSARFASNAKWLVLTLKSDSGDGEQLYPWERFAPSDDLIRWARTFVVRELQPRDRARYGLN